jgi:hypothetical protein
LRTCRRRSRQRTRFWPSSWRSMSR